MSDTVKETLDRRLITLRKSVDVLIVALRLQMERTRTLRRQLIAAQAERDAAYRGRAELLAVLAEESSESVLVHGADTNAPDWPVLFMNNWLREQVTWHVSPADLDLFEDVRQLQANDPDAPKWDGHDDAEKSRRLKSGLNIHRDCM